MESQLYVCIVAFLIGDLLYKLYSTFLIIKGQRLNLFFHARLNDTYNKRYFHFFIFQLFFVLLITGDQFLIYQLYQKETSASFLATQRIFDILPVIIMMIISPLWAVLRSGELDRRVFVNKVRMFGFYSVSIFILIQIFLFYTGDILFDIWLGETYKFEYVLVFLISSNAFLLSFYHIVNIDLQSMDKYRLQSSLMISIFIFACVGKLLFYTEGVWIFPLANTISLLFIGILYSQIAKVSR